jgi:uncharacterized protein (TIGR00255 family)
MINSMTGFASGEISAATGVLSWELRSVNHRYLEAQFKLPEGFRPLEPKLRELLNSKLARGKVDVNLQFRPAANATAALELDTALVQQLIEKARQIEDDVHISAPLAAIDILRWPGVIAEQRMEVAELFEPATASLAQALDELSAARASEGARIHATIEARLLQVSELVAQVRAHMPQVLAAIRARLKERAEALSTRIDDDRLEQELVILAQKMDVAEELDRLDAHVAETRATFAVEGAVGRKLDFLMQEFNREANTLGSKSADAETTKAAVDLKVLIEQMREQIQNVE